MGLFLTDDHNGAQILSDLRGELDKNRVCIAFVEMIPDNMVSFYYFSIKTHLQILKSSASVVIIYGDTESLHAVIQNIVQHLITWKVWVMKSQWDVSKYLSTFIFDSLHGSLIFAHQHAEISEFRKFIQTYNPSKYPEDLCLAVLWNTHFNCSFSGPDCKILGNCLPNVSLEMLPRNIWEMNMTEESYSIYNSVYAVARSVHEKTLKQVKIHPSGNGEVNSHPWEVISLFVYFINSTMTCEVL